MLLWVRISFSLDPPNKRCKANRGYTKRQRSNARTLTNLLQPKHYSWTKIVIHFEIDLQKFHIFDKSAVAGENQAVETCSGYIIHIFTPQTRLTICVMRLKSPGHVSRVAEVVLWILRIGKWLCTKKKSPQNRMPCRYKISKVKVLFGSQCYLSSIINKQSREFEYQFGYQKVHLNFPVALLGNSQIEVRIETDNDFPIKIR